MQFGHVFHDDQQWTTKLNLRILSDTPDGEAGCYTNCKKNS